MRRFAILAAASAAAMLMPGAADAARWCHSGPQAKGCAFRTQAACARAASRVGGACRRQAVAQAASRPGAMMPQGRLPPNLGAGQIYPSRPAWASPYECYYDEGYGRFRPCSSGELP